MPSKTKAIVATYLAWQSLFQFATGHPFDSPVAGDPAPFKVVFGDI
jgi:hypothetical protein